MVKTQDEQLAKDVKEVFGFLPDGYEVPSQSYYMKFEAGENKFRILASPVLGWEGWKTQEDGTKKPVRVTMQESLEIDSIDDPEEVKHFWAMPVWNYKTKNVQILEITQKTILRSIKSLSQDKVWGSPLNYDLSVVKEGEKMKTEYQVIPMPPKELDQVAKDEWNKVKDLIDIKALFGGGDPFAKLKK